MVDRETSRPRVFVSSTVRDFSDLRSALKFWLEELGFEVRMSDFNDFERQPDQATFESCFAAITDSDYYILLVGGRRGTEYPSGSGVSVTQQEYRIAAELAKKGKIKPIIFIRRDVMAALRDQGPRTASKRAKRTASSPLGILEDGDFIKSFISEIEHTEFTREGVQGPAGAMWYYQFSTFEDIIQALRVNMRIHGSVRRQTLLANLKWELEENIAALCGKSGGGPFPHHLWLSTTYDAVKLRAGNAQSTVVLDKDQVKRTATFWMVLPLPVRLKTRATQEAINSGEFFIYNSDTARLVESSIYRALQHIIASIESYTFFHSALMGDNFKNDLVGVFDALRRGAGYRISEATITFLFGVHDKMIDTLRLSVSLMRYIVLPEGGFTMPPLSPISPLADEIEKLQAENATHDDVEQWIGDGLLWSLMLGMRLGSPNDVPVIMQRYPGIKKAIDALGQKLEAEFEQRVKSEGEDAAVSWLQSLLSESKDK